MAGGRGQRLHPLTEKTPKPMLKVGSKPILEQIVAGFAAQGFCDIWLCVNYRKSLIKKYFNAGSNWGCRIRYVDEPRAFGTAGALSLLPKFDTPAIVSNADVLTEMDYTDLLRFHWREQADVTACAALYQHQVRYGVFDTAGNKMLDLREKPIENFQVNAGIYALNPEVIAAVPKKNYNMTELMLAQPNVAVYPLPGYWTDVGTFEDLAKANQEFS